MHLTQRQKINKHRDKVVGQKRNTKEKNKTSMQLKAQITGTEPLHQAI